MTQGNLSAHLNKLEAAGYVQIKKEFIGKRSHTMIRLAKRGRETFKKYVQNMKQVFNGLIE